MKIDTKKLPKKWLPLMGITFFFMICIVFAYLYFGNSQELSTVKVQKVDGMDISGVTEGINQASPQYKELVIQENQEKTKEAAKAGKSAIETPTGESPEQREPLIILEETRNALQKPIVAAPPQEKAPARKLNEQAKQETAKLVAYMNNLTKNTAPAYASESVVFQKKVAKEEVAKELAFIQASLVNKDFEIGDILYAVNDLNITSDSSGTPVMATIIHGDLSGAKIMGKFTLSGERLILVFNTLALNGQSYSFEGYAVDPDEAKSGVASNVNTHFFERWGGLVASSFIGGLGEAIGRGKTKTTISEFSSSYETEPFSSRDQALIAAGKVGDKVANQLERVFDRPPTVTLDAGVAIGVLVMKNK